MQFLLIVAISGSAFPINYIDYYANMFNNTLLDTNYSASIIMIVSYSFYIGISFTIVNKILKITDYISLNKIILMNVPLLVLNYTISNQVYLLSRFGSTFETDYWNEFSTFTSNTLGFSIIFLVGLYIVEDQEEIPILHQSVPIQTKDLEFHIHLHLKEISMIYFIMLLKDQKWISSIVVRLISLVVPLQSTLILHQK